MQPAIFSVPVPPYIPHGEKRKGESDLEEEQERYGKCRRCEAENKALNAIKGIYVNPYAVVHQLSELNDADFTRHIKSLKEMELRQLLPLMKRELVSKVILIVDLNLLANLIHEIPALSLMDNFEFPNERLAVVVEHLTREQTQVIASSVPAKSIALFIRHLSRENFFIFCCSISLERLTVALPLLTIQQMKDLLHDVSKDHVPFVLSAIAKELHQSIFQQLYSEMTLEQQILICSFLDHQHLPLAYQLLTEERRKLIVSSIPSVSALIQTGEFTLLQIVVCMKSPDIAQRMIDNLEYFDASQQFVAIALMNELQFSRLIPKIKQNLINLAQLMPLLPPQHVRSLYAELPLDTLWILLPLTTQLNQIALALNAHDDKLRALLMRMSDDQLKEVVPHIPTEQCTRLLEPIAGMTHETFPHLLNLGHITPYLIALSARHACRGIIFKQMHLLPIRYMNIFIPILSVEDLEIALFLSSETRIKIAVNALTCAQTASIKDILPKKLGFLVKFIEETEEQVKKHDNFCKTCFEEMRVLQESLSKDTSMDSVVAKVREMETTVQKEYQKSIEAIPESLRHAKNALTMIEIFNHVVDSIEPHQIKEIGQRVISLSNAHQTHSLRQLLASIAKLLCELNGTPMPKEKSFEELCDEAANFRKVKMHLDRFEGAFEWLNAQGIEFEKLFLISDPEWKLCTSLESFKQLALSYSSP